MRHLLILSGTALFIAGCASPAAEVPPVTVVFNAAAVKAVLDSMNKHYHDRFKTKTETDYTERYTSDACVMAPQMPRICGVGKIAAFYWNNGESQSTALDIHGEEVTGTSKEVTEVGSYRVLDEKGAELDKGKFIAIYRAEGGHW